jgi:hypothetical protein
MLVTDTADNAKPSAPASRVTVTRVDERGRRSTSDAPRLLHRSSEYGYTDRLDRALPREPEAVPESYQARLSALAGRRRDERLKAEWRKAARTINGAIDGFRATGLADPQIISGVRAVSRSVAAVDRRVGLQ